MSGTRWIHIVLVVVLALAILLAVRMHFAAGQVAPSGDPEQGRLYAQNWCTECHSVEPGTAGTGKFAPDFSMIARRRSARWLIAFLRSSHRIMPDFVFKPQEAADIAGYIASLKR